ncbi:MAG: cyclic pyranopterin monophosphate synthase MoaC [Defluviitaleaceae bacterium]|nr:cyclic pyranopterin monophosphate synthase MoaC [Defluviitaleaceae bacterium]
MADFTHFDKDGNAVMVDVGHKDKTERQAVASGKITMTVECYNAIVDGDVKKGDVLGTARLAGIMAVKQTANLIPLCHIIPVEQASVDFELNPESRTITALCTVKTTDKTGVEMEAMVGATMALLTIYDMCKAVDKGMTIGEVCLLKKTGGKSGTYVRASHE